uniref:Chitin-binding type-2 domain-containing protein n=1 Tax=Trichuris muris TaxID=70415 RepID=A0A5S6Q9I5_TRIMR
MLCLKVFLLLLLCFYENSLAQTNETNAPSSFPASEDTSPTSPDTVVSDSQTTETTITTAVTTDATTTTVPVGLLQIFCIWGAWGPCSTTCDYGVWTREMVTTTDPSVPCTPAQTETDTCFVAPCPIDCVVDPNWLCWTPCSAPCGGGFRYRSRMVITPALFGGAPCNESDLNEMEACNTAPCAYECRITGEWSSWTGCSSSCGGGIQLRNITFEEVLALRPGPNTTCTETEQYRFCGLSSCGATYNCLQSDWTSWSPCSVSCGSGTQYRTRRILVPSIGSGTLCGPTYEARPCNKLSCTERSLSVLCSRRRNTFIPLGRCAADYIYCTPGGQAVFNICPHGKAFNAAYGFCINKGLVPDCLTQSQAGECSGRSNGLYPLCSCCSQYLLCWEGVSTRRSCRSNEAFEASPFGRCVERSAISACRGRWP